MRKHVQWLALIILAALVVRLWQIGSLPSILNRDEAALAYNAYLLQETGTDEWGRPWPITLESFGDYKLSGYSVVLVPFLASFGLTDWAVRLPSALAGVALVGLVYGLVRKLGFPERESLFTSALIAFSPVFVFYSRMAFEANLALLYLVAAWWVLESLREKAKTRLYIVLAVLLLLAVFTYNTPLLLLPALMVYVAILFSWADRRKLLLTEGIIFGVLLIGLVILLPAISQKSGITIFTDETVWSEWVTFRTSLSQPWQTLIGSRYVYYLGLMIKNFTASLSPSFLIIRGGGHPWHSLPTTGHIFSIVYVFFFVGLVKIGSLVWVARKKLSTIKPQLALLLLFFSSLLPAIITVDAPHATRSLLFFVLLQIFAVIGVSAAYIVLKKNFQRLAWQITTIALIAAGSLHLHQLFIQYPRQQWVFQPGFKEAIHLVEQQYPGTPVAVVDPSGYHYVLLAWYLQLSPEQYFSTVVRQQPDMIGFRYGERLDRYHFIVQPSDRSADEQILIQWSAEKTEWQIETN